MSVKLARYVFKKIRGRVIPIRIGAESKTTAKTFSKKAQKKIEAALKNPEVIITKKGNVRKKEFSSSGTNAMIKFMKQSGAVRVSKSKESLMIDTERQLTNLQKSALSKMRDRGDEIFTESKSTFSMSEAFRFLDKGKKPTPKTKIADVLEDKAVKTFGTTDNPDIAGYVTRKGDLLDFSGGPGSYGIRGEDHRSISSIMGSSPAKKIDAKELTKIYQSELSKAKRERGKLHSHHKLIHNIKELQKVDFIKGKDRGELIKDNIRHIPAHKRHFLKKLKKKRNQ